MSGIYSMRVIKFIEFSYNEVNEMEYVWDLKEKKNIINILLIVLPLLIL